ncbi:MAG: choice-of-anchor D domain-containing protein [Acidimicrobiales bacterium]
MAAVIGLLSVLSALVAVPFPVTPAEAAGPAVSAARDEYGFPLWYEDSTGVRVDTCLDPNDTAHCTLLPLAGVYDPLQPISFPSNFPDEFFYHVAESDRIATPGCPTASNPLAANPGRASVRTAVEGAFANGVPAPGEQMVFARVRVIVRGGLCPNQAYTFIHPYGQTTLTTTEDGSIPSTVGTVDIGCVPTPTSPCNFGQATGSPIFTQGFLRWDPAVEPQADPGYLGGDNTVLHPIVGGINNVFTILDNTDTEVVTTNLFTVQGRLAGPLVSSSPLVDFGGQEVGTSSGERAITITNVDADPTTIASVTSSNPEFVVTPSGSCVAGLARDRDETCDVKITFTPTATGLRTGSISIAYTDGVNPRVHSPLTVAVQGTGGDPGNEPTLTVNPTALSFGAVRVGLLSQSQTVTITNTGTAPLQVTNLEFINVPGSFDSQDRQAFRVVNNTCAGVFVPATGTDTCTFGVGFQPLHSHAYAAALKVSANTSGGPVEVILDATGIGGIAAVSTGPDGFGPDGINPETGFPLWYQDEAGVRLGECIDPNDPFCIVLPDDFYTGGAISALPDYANFPEEYFYYMAESDIIDTPGCGASEPGRAFIRFADEAAFGGGGPLNGDQMVFGRVRLVVTSGLCANTTYHITHPYGEFDVTTDADGGVRRNAATTDVGCAPLGTFDCNFAEALASPVLGGFLRQVNAPPGYLGDPNLPAAVTGAPYVAVGESDPANYFRIEQGNDLIGETTQFTVMGKLVGPIMATPPSLNFGVVELLTTSDEQTVTFTNDGIAPVTVATIGTTLTGPTGQPTTDFAVTSDGCSGQTLDPISSSPGDSCTVQVTFTPQANGTRVANLFLNHSGLNNPLRVPLSGIGGAAAGEPAISVNPPTASFPDLHVGEVSASESIRVSNEGGSAPLLVGVPSISGPGAANFTLVNGCADPVPVDADCVIDVAFAPTAAGNHVASLDIPSNVVAVPVVSVPLDGRGSVASPLASATTDPAGFPSYYGDNNGVRLEPCYDPGNPQDPNCVVLGDGGYNPANPLSFPGNFPGEFFYSLVDSEPLTIPADGACAGGGGDGGTAFLRVALEGTFATGTPLAGQQIMFARVRINATGLCNNTTYEFVHPYGTSTLTTDGEGVIRSTTDVPNVVGSTLLSNGFLRWDPNEGPQAPAGYLGDARTFHTVVGSIYRPEGPGTEPVNYFEVVGGQLDHVSTDKFLVSGRMAGPVVADRTAIDFGPQGQGTASANQTVTLTNLSPDAVDSLVVSLTGDNAADFSLTEPPAGTCTPATSLEQDQTCTVNVAFTPEVASLGGRTATLSVAHSGGGSPITVALTGTATTAGNPEITISRTSMAFGNQTVGSPSAAQTVIVSNTGTMDLTVTAVETSGSGATSFSVTNGCVDVVHPVPGAGSTCIVSVVFNPTSNGAKAATLTISSDDPTRPAVTVALSGSGVSPTAQFSPTSLSFSTGRSGSSTKSIDVTNTGSAPFSLVGAPAITITQVGGQNRFTATHNCNNVAPGGKCRISVTWNSNNIARGTYNATMTVLTNATNQPVGGFQVNLSVTVK